MKKHWQYLRYILRHKWFVFKACLRLKVPLHLAIVHDWSKFLPDEWFPYADYFYDKELQQKENIEAFSLFGLAELAPFGYYAKDRFNMAWLYHQRRNKHHWQYWYLIQDTEPNFPLPMPEVYAREMVADWIGAGMAIAGRSDPSEWYEKNKEKMLLRDETRLFVESLLRGLTPHALDRGDSAVDAALSTPEGYTGKAGDTKPAPGK